MPKDPEPNLSNISYLLNGESLISSKNNLFEIDIDDSPSYKKDMPTDEHPKEFFLSWIILT